MDERKILGKTEHERKEIYATPAWLALRWLFALLFYTARHLSATKGFARAERFIR